MRLALLAGALCILGLLIPLWPYQTPRQADLFLWIIDLASHWQWLYVAVLSLCVLRLAFKDRRWLLLLLFVALPWISASPRAPVHASGEPGLSIVEINANIGNPNHDRLIDWLQASDTDIIVVLEVSHTLSARLRALSTYPFQEIVSRSDPFGIAVLSRLPLEGTAVDVDSDGIPRISTRVLWPAQPFDLAALHPMPPLSGEFHVKRDLTLAEIVKQHVPLHQPLIVVGDMNASPWSSAFSGLVERGLQRSGSLAPTWPATFRGWFGIPIDHVLVSPQWQVEQYDVGADIGSDHLPIRVELSPIEPGLAEEAQAISR